MMYEPKALGAAADPMAMYRQFLQQRMMGGGGGGMQFPAMPMAQPQQPQGLLGGDQNLGSLLSMLRQGQGGGLLGQQSAENSLGGVLGMYSQGMANATGYQGQGPFIPAAWHRG